MTEIALQMILDGNHSDDAIAWMISKNYNPSDKVKKMLNARQNQKNRKKAPISVDSN